MGPMCIKLYHKVAQRKTKVHRVLSKVFMHGKIRLIPYVSKG